MCLSDQSPYQRWTWLVTSMFCPVNLDVNPIVRRVRALSLSFVYFVHFVVITLINLVLILYNCILWSSRAAWRGRENMSSAGADIEEILRNLIASFLYSTEADGDLNLFLSAG